MSEKPKTRRAKKDDAQGEEFKLTSPPDQDPEADEVVRVNLFISKSLHKRIRKYAIDHDDKSLVATIQDVLGAYLKGEGY